MYLSNDIRKHSVCLVISKKVKK